MADVITTILRASGEAPDPALRSSRLAQGFARLILRLTSLRRAEARLFERSLADPEHRAGLNQAEALWAECTERLDLLSDPPIPTEPALAPMVQAARLMRSWLAARSTCADEIGASWLAREAARVMPRGESRLCWQAGRLITEAFDLFSAVTGLSGLSAADWASPGEVETAIPAALGWPSADGRALSFPGRSAAIAMFPGAFDAGAPV